MAIYDTKTGVTVLDSQVPFVTGNLPPKLEKRYMNPIRFRTNYRIIPAYILLVAVCIGLGLVLMEIDEERFLPAFIGLFALMGIASVLLMLSVPKTRKKELEYELARYDLDYSDVPVQDQYTIAYEGSELVLSANGLTLDGKFYWYSHLNPALVVSNKFNRIWLAIWFGNDPMKSLYVPLDPVLLRSVEALDIPLENREELESLLKNKENAFAQIYSYGTFWTFED